MTPAQRETRMTDHEATLRELAAGLLAQGRISAEELYSYSPGQRADIIRKSERNADACLAGADALRAALVERGTCGNCVHYYGDRCTNLDQRQYALDMPPDDGCIKGWSPREDAPEDAR